MIATSMLSNYGNVSVDVSALPGGVQDAWALLSEASQRGLSTTATSATAAIHSAMGGNDSNNIKSSKLAQLQKLDMTRDGGNLNEVVTSTSTNTGDSNHDAARLSMGQGQLGKATIMTSLSACIQRTSDLTNTLINERRPRDGQVLKSALQFAKSKLNLIDPLSAPTSVTSTPEAMAATTHMWMKIVDQRLKEIRSYHARNDHYYSHVETMGGGPQRDIGGTARVAISNKRPRLGNPAADGYDLASSVWEKLEGIRDGTLFSAEEVMGKYLDLQSIYETHAVPIKTLLGEALPHSVKKDNFNYTETKGFGFFDFLAVLSKGDGGLSEGITESSKLKERKKYARFLMALELYLQGFLKRTQPLLSIEEVTKPAIQEFSTQWLEKGGCPGWEYKPAQTPIVPPDTINNIGDSKANSVGLDLTLYQTAADLEKAVDGDALKGELNRLGLKCGGTVSDRAKRLFLTKDTPLDKLPSFCPKNNDSKQFQQ
jgi:hypothetical protein